MRTISYLEDSYSKGLWDSAAIDRAFRSAGVHIVRAHRNQVERLLGRAVKQVRVGGNIFRGAGKARVVVLCWASDSLLFPRGLFCETIPFVYDCWPPQYDAWLGLFQRWRIRVAFFSSKASTLFFGKKLPEIYCYWIPEAVDVDVYEPSSALSTREIDILEYGRHFPILYDSIARSLDSAKRSHFFAKDKIVTHKTLVPMIGASKLVVCYPKSMTDPKNAAPNETVTQRYFEAMASRALPIGYCPAELKELFGYNPVVELDLSRAGEQIEGILRNIETYQELADRNLQRLKEVGTWNVRVQQMLSILGQHGYRVPAITG